MSEKTREICTVVSQESIGAGIYSMWIQTDRIAADAKPGQFVSLYTNDKSKILPRPISLCEIDKENGRLHLVYRVTGQGTGTDEFSQMKAGDIIPVLGPLGNGFPQEGENVFLIGGGIGVPPMLQTAKDLGTDTIICCGYRDELFLNEEFAAAGDLHIATEDGSAGVKGNVMDAVREDHLEADVIFPDGKTHVYSIPAIKMADYTKDHIFEKNLLMLLPFYIMRYEKKKHDSGCRSVGIYFSVGTKHDFRLER